MAVDKIEKNLDGTNLTIGIVISRFNEYAGKELYAACHKELNRLGVRDEDITVVTVPGALETPYALSKLAKTCEYDALIALGAVIRGDTYHFEIVSNEAARGISRVALDNDIPIANGVLTCDTDEQCKARTAVKGTECASCAVEMANLGSEIPTLDEIYDRDFSLDEDEDDER